MNDATPSTRITAARAITPSCHDVLIDEAPDIVTEMMHLRASIGDGMNDFELTEFLKSRLGVSEDGFSFLCISQGCATFGVPTQNVRQWYGENCTIHPAKERIAQAIANDHRLNLCEPPDKLVYGSPGPGAHRHLEFANRWRTVAVAHPLYVKLRIFCGGEHDDLPVESDAAITQCAQLLHDLSDLYR